MLRYTRAFTIIKTTSIINYKVQNYLLNLTWDLEQSVRQTLKITKEFSINKYKHLPLNPWDAAVVNMIWEIAFKGL